MRYLLIDEGAFDDHHLASLRNLVATVFRVEFPDTPERINELVRSLDLWLGDEPELRRMFATWIRATLIRQSKYTLHLPELQDLKKLDMALAQRMKQWAHDYKQEGRQESLQEGETKALKRLLIKRFGAIAPALLSQIESATLETIETWFDRAPAWIWCLHHPSTELSPGQAMPLTHSQVS